MFMPRRKKFIFIPFAIVAVALLMGWVVMFLWNAILPTVTGVSALTYWQAVGLLVLCKLLFGGFRGGGRPPYSKSSHWREKWQKMNEEERTQFKAAWRERCNRREG